MPDSGSGLSRPCPSCGRRVPSAVAVCRCGADVPALATGATDSPEPKTGFSVLNLVVGLLLLVGVAATGYWSVTRPPAVTPIGPGPRGEVPRGGFRVVPFEGGPPISRTPEAGPAEAPPPEKSPAVPADAPAPDAAALEDVVGRVMPAVVLVEASAARGSGFYVRPDTLLTNLHVVKDDGFVKLHRVDGTTVTARVDLRAPAFDLAILRVTAPAANQVVIPLGTANTLRPGQEVVTIGSPFGTLRNSVTRGVVSGLRRSGAATMVQNDATSHPGNSGGPLLDRHGVAVGVTTMSAQDKPGINYAVAIDHATAILDGRVAESTAAPLALNNVKALEPVPSESQRSLAEGERAFLAAAARVARTADAMDAGWKQFRQSCYTSAIAGSFSHEWFVMLTPRPITPSQVGTGPCGAFVTGFQADADRLAATMRSALDSARRAGVLPGVVRDALRTNRLEFDGWDR